MVKLDVLTLEIDNSGHLLQNNLIIADVKSSGNCRPASAPLKFENKTDRVTCHLLPKSK